MRVTLFAVALCVVAGCGKKKEEPSSATPTTTEAKPVETKRTNINGEPVDVCGQMPKDKVEAVVGKITRDPQPTEGQGSMLGQCTWSVESGFALVSARPASEYEGTVKYAEDPKEVAGIGEKAYSTKHGLLVKVPGKQYMLQVFVAGGDDDGAKTQALTKLALELLK